MGSARRIVIVPLDNFCKLVKLVFNLCNQLQSVASIFSFFFFHAISFLDNALLLKYFPKHSRSIFMVIIITLVPCFICLRCLGRFAQRPLIISLNTGVTACLWNNKILFHFSKSRDEIFLSTTVFLIFIHGINHTLKIIISCANKFFLQRF